MKSKRERAAKKRYHQILAVLTGACLLVLCSGILRNMCDKAEEAFRYGGSVEKEWIDISGDMTDGIPKLYQTDSRWAKKQYGSNLMEINGCGPTCLSMVYCGLTGDTKWNPYAVAKMAEEKGYYVSGVGTSWSFMTEGAENLGLKGEEMSFRESTIRETLKSGTPVICAMGPGDFTTEGHFIVLTGVDQDGKIKVNDPNSKELSDKTWELERLMGQMKNLWSYKK